MKTFKFGEVAKANYVEVYQPAVRRLDVLTIFPEGGPVYRRYDKRLADKKLLEDNAIFFFMDEKNEFGSLLKLRPVSPEYFFPCFMHEASVDKTTGNVSYTKDGQIMALRLNKRSYVNSLLQQTTHLRMEDPSKELMLYDFIAGYFTPDAEKDYTINFNIVYENNIPKKNLYATDPAFKAKVDEELEFYRNNVQASLGEELTMDRFKNAVKLAYEGGHTDLKEAYDTLGLSRVSYSIPQAQTQPSFLQQQVLNSLPSAQVVEQENVSVSDVEDLLDPNKN